MKLIILPSRVAKCLALLTLLVSAVNAAQAQTNWTGSVSNEWNDPANWTAGVPDGDDDVVIPSVTTAPVIASGVTGVVHSMVVEANVMMAVASGGKLTITGFAAHTTPSAFTAALLIRGHYFNDGELIIGSTSSAGDWGVYNTNYFENNGGTVRIDSCVLGGVFNTGKNFRNMANLFIGSASSVGSDGIVNRGQIANTHAGNITIDRTSVEGIFNSPALDGQPGAKFVNDAQLTIGGSASVGVTGLESQGTFENRGTLRVDRATTSGMRVSGIFANMGNIIVGAAVPGTYSLSLFSSMSNQTCAGLHLFSALDNHSYIFNYGLLEISSASPSINTYDIDNDGIITFPRGNAIPNIDNKEIVLEPRTVISCESVNQVFGLGTPMNSNIIGVYTDEAGFVSAGVYNNTANSFAPAASLGEGVHDLFVRIEYDSHGSICAQMVPWKLTVTACCEEAVFAEPTVVQSSCTQSTGTITVNATSGGTLEYSVNNGGAWSDSPAFSNLSPGNYDLKVRLKASPACETSYSSNPVVISQPYSATSVDTWTGCLSTAWAEPANWQDGTVPTSTDDVTIPNVANAPVIGATAVAKSLQVQSGAWLTINSGAELTIHASMAYTVPFGFAAGINNEGRIDNKGTLVVGVTSPGDFGIINQQTFNNNAGGTVRIDRSTNTAFYNASGTFTNLAALTVGQNAPVGLHGIWNDAVFNNNDDAVVVVSNSTLRALVNNADESKSIHATFNNAATIAIGVAASAGTVGIRNLASFKNNAGGNIIIDHTTDIGLYNSAGTFTNSADITIGVNSSTGTHGLVNEGVFEHEGTANLWIGRATGSSLYHAAGTFRNAGTIIIGTAAVSGGTTGIESRAAFDNYAGGDILINKTSEVGLYHIAGTFTNDGNVTIGNSAAVGLYGLRNTGEFRNNAEGSIRIDRSTTGGLIQTNADAPAPGAIFTNGGDLTIGNAVAVGADGLENQGTFINTGAGHIHIDRTTSIALKTPFGTFTNEAQITIGHMAGVGTYGLVNRSTFKNNGAGHIRIDRSTDTGLYHSGGTFTNDAKLTIGADNSPGINGIFNESAFNNEDNGDIRIDRASATGLRNFQNTITNAGSIIIGGVSTVVGFGILNQATFQNNAGGLVSLQWSYYGIRSVGVFENAGTVQFGAPDKVVVMLTSEGGSFNNNAGGIVKGTGAINAQSLTCNGGTLSPGYSPGKLTFNDSQDFTNSILDMELNGIGTAGTDYDQIAVTGQATLGGTLAVAVNYTPNIGDQFTILTATTVSGTFSAVTGLALGWKVLYEENAVKLRYDDPMPVTLVSFNARTENAIVKLEWRTTSETNNAGFYIERSADAFNWSDIGFVDGNATTSVVKDYTFRDENPLAGLSYYRLRQTDFDGTTERSRVAAVRFADPAHSVAVWADAVRQVHIKSSEAIRQVAVFDLSGRTLIISKEPILNLSHAAAGIVLVRVTTAGGTVVKRVFLY